MNKRAAVTQTVKMLLDGHSETDIREYLLEYGKPQKPKLIIRAALDNFKTIAAAPKATRLGFCQEAARELYRRMVEVGDYAGALRAIQELAKLTDAYAAAKATKAAKPAPKAAPTKTAELLSLVRKNG